MKTKRIEQLDRNFKAGKVKAQTPLRWLAPGDRRLAMSGLAWFRENKGKLYRLPRRAEKKVRLPVWQLGQCPASAHIGFCTDSTQIAVRVTLENMNFMAHIPATGSHGLSLYCGGAGQWRYWATAIPDLKAHFYERTLFAGAAQTREFRLYLPLYGILKELEIGFDRNAQILPPATPRTPKPIVFYGTSITQGGCANTPGSDFVSIIGRQLNREVVNLGFSGNGQGDPELAELMGEITAGLYVLDYAANVEPDKLRSTLPPFVRILRARHPRTPILILSEVYFARSDSNAETHAKQESRRDIMMAFYIKQRQAGDKNIHLADGFGLLPFGAGGVYVDGVHPTSYGFALMAERLGPQISRIMLHPA